MAEKMGKFSRDALALAKRGVRQSLELGETAGIEHERTLFIATMGLADKREGVSAFLEKRKPKFNQ